MSESSEDLGTKLVLENDRVRIWEHRVAPAAIGPMHLHRRPYFSTVVQGSRGETIAPDGTVIETFDLTPGAVYWYGDEVLPETHALRNIGGGEIVIITTELL